MIEGLKITVTASELRILCESRAEYHRERVKAYDQQIVSMEEAHIEGMNYTNGDPRRAMTDRKVQHENDAAELDFIANHLAVGEVYLLDRSDLNRLGITKTAY